MITIVDYGLGNILAFANMYKRLNIDIAVAKGPEDLRHATKIILPGVGAFDHAMERLEASGMRPTLDDLVLGKGLPVVGICVGMQILAESSEEGQRPGLGYIKGKVLQFRMPSEDRTLPLPHMGWNDVQPRGASPLFHSLETDARFYFLHSFYIECTDQEDVLAETQYGLTFASAVRHGNVYGIQFHPEKSHHWGRQLLKNYSDL